MEELSLLLPAETVPASVRSGYKIGTPGIKWITYGAISPDMIQLVRALHSQQPIKLFEIMLLYSPHKLFGDELIFARQTVRWESVDELGADQYQPSNLNHMEKSRSFRRIL